MYHVSVQGTDECMIKVHYYYYYFILLDPQKSKKKAYILILTYPQDYEQSIKPYIIILY